jgi:hypothetical protein
VLFVVKKYNHKGHQELQRPLLLPAPINLLNQLNHPQSLLRSAMNISLPSQHIQHIAINIPMVARTPLIKTIIIRRQSRQQIRHRIILNIARQHLLHILSTHLHRPMLRQNRNATLQILLMRRSAIRKRTHTTLQYLKIKIATILKLNPRVIKILKPRIHRLNIAKQPQQRIHKMTKLRKQSTPILPQFPLPRTLLVIRTTPVPQAIYLHLVYLSHSVRTNQIFQPSRRRRIPILHHTKHPSIQLLRHRNHLPTLRSPKPHRLLQHHIISLPHPLNRLHTMQIIRRTNRRHPPQLPFPRQLACPTQIPGQFNPYGQVATCPPRTTINSYHKHRTSNPKSRIIPAWRFPIWP